MAKSTYILELERRTNDLIRVYNPTNQDYVVQWDRKNGSKLFRFVAKTEQVIVRYIGEKYVKEMYQKIINEKIDKAIIEENEKRLKKGFAEMDKTFKTNEQMKFEQSLQPTTEEAKKIISLLYMGLENEYGIDDVVEEESQTPYIEKPVYQQAFEDVVESKSNGESMIESKNGETISKKHKCNYPGCNFGTDTPVALAGHKRSHRSKEDLEIVKNKAVQGVSK